MEASRSVLKIADDILADFDGPCQVVDSFTTLNHVVLKAETNTCGIVCLKINRMVFDEPGRKAPKVFPAGEIEVFRIIDGVPWAPRMLASAPDNSWMIREWLGGRTTDKLYGADWTRARINDFWRFMDRVIGYFHALDPPMVIRDVKPQNISYDDNAFYFFDLNTAVPIDFARKSGREPRIGNKSNLFMAPEIVQSDVDRITLNSDIFSFATLVHKFLTGDFAWSNSVADLEGSRRQYLAEYGPAAEKLNARMQELGFGPMDRAFMCACLHPDPARRPDRMQPPH